MLMSLYLLLLLAIRGARSQFSGPCTSYDGLLGFYKGSENAAVCCPKSCGECNSDQFCSKRPGGRHECCPGMIRRLGKEKECSISKEAPCPIRKRCKEWKPMNEWRAPYPYPSSRKLLATSMMTKDFRVLLLIPVGKKKAEIVSDTCQKALALNISLFLAHYDHSQAWYADTYPEWYSRVEYSVNYKDFKANYVRKELVKNQRFARIVRQRFSHVWVIDDDIHFPQLTVLSAFLQSVQSMNPLIAQPAIHGSWQQLVTPDHQPRGSLCPVWSTDFVEVMAPIIKSNVLLDIYSRLISQTSNSDWGLDMVWCRYAAKRYRRETTPDRACLIIKPDGAAPTSSFLYHHDRNLSFHKADRISARPNYFKVYQHSYSTAASLWDKRCMKHNLLPLWAQFQSKCIKPPTHIQNILLKPPTHIQNILLKH